MPISATLDLVIARDLAATRREVEAYPDERLIWAAVPGLANSGGVLVRHICGNLQHFIGTVLGGTDYRRTRDAEFAGPPDSRDWLLREIDQTARSVAATLPRLTTAQLLAEYPLPIADHRLETERFLVHLAVHLGFHLGQLDYHRRAVTGQATSIAPMGVPSLA
jgi:hypothetical protein